jgi:ATP-dependent Clp protease protease subunit
MPKYYALEQTDSAADLYIFGDIAGYGQMSEDDPDRSAYNIINELKNISADSVNVHINSMGGDVGEGLAIYNTLKNSGKNVTTYCDGFACSAASVVFMAGSERVMSRETLLMIHNAWMASVGNADDLRKDADDLDKINETMSNAYLEGTNISKEDLKALMDNETWITADEAVQYGFATKIIGDDDTKASAMASIKAKLTTIPKADAPKTSDIADAVSAKVIEALEQKMAEKKEEKAEAHELTGWDKFFKGKEENK